MIKLTRLKEETVILINEAFISSVEECPDTVIALQNGHKYFVTETADEIMEKIVEFRKECRKV